MLEVRGTFFEGLAEVIPRIAWLDQGLALGGQEEQSITTMNCYK